MELNLADYSVSDGVQKVVEDEKDDFSARLEQTISTRIRELLEEVSQQMATET